MCIRYRYNLEKLSLTAEYALRSVEDKGFGEGFDKDIVGESYYLQAEYRFNDHWQAILRYDVFHNDRKDRNGRKFEAQYNAPAHSQFAKDWTAGVRYHFNPSLLVAAEYHFIDGTAWIVPLQDNSNPSAMGRYWNLFALACLLYTSRCV